MEPSGVLPVATVALIAVVAVLSGPLGPVDLTTAPTCGEAAAEQAFPGDGNATVTPVSVPDRATITKSSFGAAVWRLDLPPATVNVSDVSGRPTVSYRISVPELGRTVGTTAVLSRCTTGERRLALDRSTFEPERIDADRYDATLYVVYRGTANGTDVEETLVARNVTVEVVR
jgi:hypothetical protein